MARIDLPYLCNLPRSRHTFAHRNNATRPASDAVARIDFVGRGGNTLWQVAFGLFLVHTYGYRLSRESVPKLDDFSFGAKLRSLFFASEGWRAARQRPVIWSEWPRLGIPFCPKLRDALEHGRSLHVGGFFQSYHVVVQPLKERLRRLMWLPACGEGGRTCPASIDLVIHLRQCPAVDSNSEPGCVRRVPKVAQVLEYMEAVVAAFARSAAADAVVWLVTQPECYSSAPARKLEARARSLGLALRLRANASVGADFAFLAGAAQLVLTPDKIATSTFGWWAAFLSRAHTVHMPLSTCTYDWWRGALGLCASDPVYGRLGGAFNPCAFKNATQPPRDSLLQSQPLLPLDEPRYVYHDVQAGRYFGRYVANASGRDSGWIRFPRHAQALENLR